MSTIDKNSTTRAFWRVTREEINQVEGNPSPVKTLMYFYNYQDAYVFMKGVNATCTGKTHFSAIVTGATHRFMLESSEMYIGDR